jgi:hypothetical protein
MAHPRHPRCSFRSLACVAVVLAATACGSSHRLQRQAPPAALDDAPAVLGWGGLARPELLHTIASWLAAGEPGRGPCPRVERDGALTVITGDCTNESGSRRMGWARIVTGPDEVRARLRGFGDEEQRVWGRLRVSTEGDPRFALDVRVQSSAPMQELAPGATWLAIDASGYRDARGRWFVEGELAAEGKGRVRVRGTDIAFDDDRCAHEPLAGRTELWAGKHHVEIRYDGATDCQDPGTARWWRDGVAQGELGGIPGESGCSVASPRGTDALAGLLVLLVAIGGRRWRTLIRG